MRNVNYCDQNIEEYKFMSLFTKCNVNNGSKVFFLTSQQFTDQNMLVMQKRKRRKTVLLLFQYYPIRKASQMLFYESNLLNIINYDNARIQSIGINV